MAHLQISYKLTMQEEKVMWSNPGVLQIQCHLMGNPKLETCYKLRHETEVFYDGIPAETCNCCQHCLHANNGQWTEKSDTNIFYPHNKNDISLNYLRYVSSFLIACTHFFNYLYIFCISFQQ